jgi:hypothetical protein
MRTKPVGEGGGQRPLAEIPQGVGRVGVDQPSPAPGGVRNRSCVSAEDVIMREMGQKKGPVMAISQSARIAFFAKRAYV